MFGKNPVDLGLRYSQYVPVRSIEVRGCRFADPREESTERILAAVREELVQQPALLHDFDAAHMDAEGTDELSRLLVLVHDDDIDAL